MYLIFGKNKVGQAVASLCDYFHISYEMKDDSDGILDFDRYEAIIPSPGVPSSHAIYATGKVLSECDFAYSKLPRRGFTLFAVTGTDGKSTTAWILYKILQKHFFVKDSCKILDASISNTQRVPTFLSGNFDIPFSATVLEILQTGVKKGNIVIEVSSFMAYALGKYASTHQDIVTFEADYTIVTNMESDHLNWHKDLQEYFDAKMNLVHNTRKKAIVNKKVYDFAKKHHIQMEELSHVRLFEFVSSKKTELTDWTNGEDIIIAGKRRYSVSETQFSGAHNALNILSVGMLLQEIPVCFRRSKVYLQDISGLPHRLEQFAVYDGVRFVDDSKSTSAQSLEAALDTYKSVHSPKNLLLIVGGSDKGDTFDHLIPLFQERVAAMVCMGETKEHFITIATTLHIPFFVTNNMNEGVRFLFSQKKYSENVLMLSPGCASFGLFRDYLDRAHQFRDAVSLLVEEHQKL